jgi:molecular chaperone GrpE
VAEQDPKQTESEQPAEQAEPSAEAAPQEEGIEPVEQADPVESGEAAEGAEGADDVALEDLVAQLQEEVAAARDQALRAQAEAQNTKRRAEQDVEKARKFALEQFTRDLLPVVDNLERALEAASSGEEVSKPIAEGVELTLKSFLDAMGRFNIEKVDPVGEPFDPNMHQAMSMVENDQVEPNSVIAVVQKGYTLNGRLVRPAMVMVSKASN